MHVIRFCPRIDLSAFKLATASFLFSAFAVAGVMADGLHGQGRQGRAQGGRRQQQQFRSGRQEAGGDLAQYADSAAAPIANYGANDAGLNDAAGAGDDNLVNTIYK